MAASALPVCVPKGASGRPLQVPSEGFQPLCCTDYNGDGVRTVWLESGGSSPPTSWREPDGDATHPSPESALRYLGNELQSPELGLLVEGGTGLCWGLGCRGGGAGLGDD